MKILITGGAGFLGTHLSEKCINNGFIVYVIDDLSNGSLNNLCTILHKKNFKFIKGDVRNKEPLNKLPKDFDIIFHLAAGMESTQEAFEVNVEGTRNILETIRKGDIGIKRFIYMSSTRAMGLIKSDRPLNENSPCKPDTLYGKSKYEAEKLVREFKEDYGIETTIFRPPRIYGPRDWQRTFYDLIKLIEFGIVPKIGLILNLIYVKNLVHVLMLASRKKGKGGTYIITDDRPYEIDEIIKTIEEILEKKVKLRIRLPKQFFKVYSLLTNSFRYALKNITYSIEKVKKEIDYRPVYSLKESMWETMKWYKLI